MERKNIILIIIYLLILSLFFVNTREKDIKSKKIPEKKVSSEKPEVSDEIESSDEQEVSNQVDSIEQKKITKKQNSTELVKYNKTELFKDMLDNHYNKLFPNNGNRNAAGFRFFQYIYDNLAKNEELFDIYNTFYCAVSGSIVSPDRVSNHDILKVKDMNGNCVVGKYYRCCTPCNCDIMKYTKIIKTQIAIPKNSNNMVEKQFITIDDPCINEENIPLEMDKSVINCQNNLVGNGYRINDNGELTKDKGRLIIGILYPIENNNETEKMLNISIDRCVNGNKRFLTKPDDLKYGMGDIFVKFALLNNNDKFTHTNDDFCK